MGRALEISDAVQLALLGSVTLAVVGLLGTVITYYFTGKKMVEQVTVRFVEEVMKGQNARMGRD
jgi:hypothetical protein